MTYMHNRRGSVLLMAIGMLTILAILASTFVIISNLDSQETESLALRAGAEPITDGLQARAIAQIGADRAVNDVTGPYGNMPTGADGWVRYMDYPHGSYGEPAEFTNPEQADPWLATNYLGGEGIGGHFTNIDANTNNDDYNFDEIPFSENGTYPDGLSDDGKHIDTDGDGIPDATLYDTGIPSPLSDANNYWAAMRIVDLSAKICVNTGGGWSAADAPDDRPYGSGPAMINLRGFLDNRAGMGTAVSLYDMFHKGTTSGSTTIKGRIGDNIAAGGTSLEPSPGSLKGYDKYCGRHLLSPSRRGYQPFGIGDEAFFLQTCRYADNISMFGGRFNDMLAPSATGAILSDQVRRQLTTMSSVSAAVRDPSSGFPELLQIDAVENETDCKLVYDRMLDMLDKTGVGIEAAGRNRMAAHFAANLWAYNANATNGEPWAFTPEGESFTVYGLRQDLVITQAFARHVANAAFDANEPDKDNSAWGYAIELANPTKNIVFDALYELEVKPEGLPAITTKPFSGIFFGSNDRSIYPPKKVVYFHGCGAGAAADHSTPTKFFGVSTSGWTKAENDALDFRKGVESISITLYRKVGSTRVPLDHVSVGANNCDLVYDTNVKPIDISGDYDNDVDPTEKEDKCTSILRDDRMIAPNPLRRLARYNMAMYLTASDTSNTKLGQYNQITETQLDVRSYYGMAGNRPDVEAPTFSPAIYRPRSIAVNAPLTSREALPKDDYFLPSLASLCNVYLAGPISDGGQDRPFTTEIMREDLSNVFKNRADIGRIPSVEAIAPLTTAEIVDRAPDELFPDVPPGYLFHEFFTRVPADQATPIDPLDPIESKKKRIYGMVNVNTLGIPDAPSVNCAAWWLPWPSEDSTANRLALGQAHLAFSRSDALIAIRDYRDLQGDCTDRADWTKIVNLRSAAGSKIRGFLTPGEVGIPLAEYMDTLIGNDDSVKEDADYVRTRNALFGYISDCLSTRSDVFACYITVQHGPVAHGKRWRYVTVIDRSNVLRPTDKPALLMRTPIR